MIILSKFLKVNLKERKIKDRYYLYSIQTSSYESNSILINYLNKNRLYSSKYLNYIDLVKAINLKKEKKILDINWKRSIIILKEGMN